MQQGNNFFVAFYFKGECGYKHNMGMYDINSCVVYPEWLGNNDFHIAHQSNLIRKKPEFYIPIFGNIPDNLEYIWPTKL